MSSLPTFCEHVFCLNKMSMQQLVAKFLRQERDVLQDWLVIKLPILGEAIKHCKYMDFLAGFSVINSALFGSVIFYDPCKMREGSIAMFTKRPANINYEFRVSFVLFADTMTSHSN